MTKILIFSDSHGDVETMCKAVGDENPNIIIHLGDSIKDAEKLNVKYPDIEMIKILGNIDSHKKDEQWVQYAEICGKRFMLTHGHKFIENTSIYGKAQQDMWLYAGDADIILYGHTHEPFLNCSYRKWIMNPGRIGRISSKLIHATYGTLEIGESGFVKWNFTEAQ